MPKYRDKNKGHPLNNRFLNHKTQPIDLVKGNVYERELTGNSDPLKKDGYNDGYKEDGYGDECCGNNKQDSECVGESSGYHRFKLEHLWKGIDPTNRQGCPSPYYRLGMMGGILGAIKNREEMLMKALGKPAVLLRRNYTGPKCLCYNEHRGQARSRCTICFGVGYIPGYIPFINEKEQNGYVYIRFGNITEKNPLTDSGYKQEVEVKAWVQIAPIIRQRDIFVCFDPITGVEEYRYEVLDVTVSDIGGGVNASQSLTLKRLDPTHIIYSYDYNKVPDLKDISVDISDVFDNNEQYEIAIKNQMYNKLKYPPDDGDYQNIYIETILDGLNSKSFEIAYKESYETNYKRALQFLEPLETPDFDLDSIIKFEDGYGSIFLSSNNQIIKFSFPQDIINNYGVNEVEVILAEAKNNFLLGWALGYKDAYNDAELYLEEIGKI